MPATPRTLNVLPCVIAAMVFLLALPLWYLAVAPAPAQADLDFIAFESCTLPSGEPCPPSGAGDAPVGATLRFRFFTDCRAVRVDWGDRTSSQTATQPANTINAMTATHVYQRGGTYTIEGTDQCDFVTETNTVTIGGGGALGIPVPFDLGNPAAVAALLGILGGAAILALAFAPLPGGSPATAGIAPKTRTFTTHGLRNLSTKGRVAGQPGGRPRTASFTATPPMPPPPMLPHPPGASPLQQAIEKPSDELEAKAEDARRTGGKRLVVNIFSLEATRDDEPVSEVRSLPLHSVLSIVAWTHVWAFEDGKAVEPGEVAYTWEPAVLGPVRSSSQTVAHSGHVPDDLTALKVTVHASSQVYGADSSTRVVQIPPKVTLTEEQAREVAEELKSQLKKAGRAGDLWQKLLGIFR